MSNVKEFIRENFNEAKITIPWDLHPFITMKDIAFISLHSRQFRLDNQYFSYIDTEEYNDSCQESDNLRVVKEFENKENVCLLVAVLFREGCHNNIYSTIEIDYNDSQELFTKEFLENAWNYAITHNLALGLLGDTIKKLGYRPKIDADPFTSCYFINFRTKNARSRTTGVPQE